MQRLNKLIGHITAETSDEGQNKLVSSWCIGENENRQTDESSSKTFTRVTIKIAFPDNSMADERYGGIGTIAFLEGELLKPKTQSKTVFIFMHPSGVQNLLPMPMAMARSGLHVVTCTSRYPNNDSCLIMEKVLIDLSECIKHMKKHFGYEKIVLAGWSGGGSLSSFYQAQAESKNRITCTPAGDAIDLSGLVPADGLLILAAHTSRAKIFTEWIDPAVMDESDPTVRDLELDLWDPRNPNKPPFTKEYIARFRQAQVDRNRRITRWAVAKLREVESQSQLGKDTWKRSNRDHPFVVRCTQADLRRIDVNLEPNGRVPTSLEELAAENHSPVGLARFTTCRSWLSQWSYDLSNADGVSSLRNVSVPVLVLENGSDHLVPNSHPQQMYQAIPHNNKLYIRAEGATHYYYKQKELMAEVILKMKVFLKEQRLWHE